MTDYTGKCPFDDGIPPQAVDGMARVIEAYRRLKALDPSNKLLDCLEIDADEKGFRVNIQYVDKFVTPEERNGFMDASNWEVRLNAYARCVTALNRETGSFGESISPTTAEVLERRGIDPESTVGFDRINGKPIRAKDIYCVEDDSDENKE